MVDKISLFSSIATLILFVFYFIGRIITIISVKRVWKDKVIIDGIKNMNFEYINSDYKDLVLESIQILNNKSYQLIKNKKDIFVSN